MSIESPTTPVGASVRSEQLDEILSWLRGYLSKRFDARLADERRSMPPHVVLDLGNKGLLGMHIPRSCGGMLELNHFEMLRVQRQLGAIDLSLAFFVGLNNALGVRPILKFGSPAMRERYLPALATGRILGAFAITEESAGSHPLGIEATARRSDRGYCITGDKIWCGSAGWADVMSVFVRHEDAQGRHAGHIGLCVDGSQGGMRIGPEAMTLGMRAMVQNRVYFDDAVVTDERVLATPFAGLSVAADAMQFGRLGIAATSVGAMWRALQLMLRYSGNRTIQTGKLFDNGHTQHVLAETWHATTVLGKLVDGMAEALDAGQSPPAELYAAVKLLASEALWRSADSALQMLGGRGYCENNVVSRMLRDARVTRLFEGPSETLASFVGSRALEGAKSLHQHFGQRGARGRQALSAVVELIQDLRSKDLVDDYNVQGRQRLHVALGYAVSWQLVAANVDCDGAQQAWIQSAYRRAIDTLAANEPTVDLASLQELTSVVHAAIGDVELAAAGEEFELDSLLRSY